MGFSLSRLARRGWRRIIIVIYEKTDYILPEKAQSKTNSMALKREKIFRK